MNFKVRDKAFVIGAASSVLTFSLGLFSGVFVSQTHIFLVNIVIFITAAVTMLSAMALLTAAVEVFAKLQEYPNNKYFNIPRKIHHTITGYESRLEKETPITFGASRYIFDNEDVKPKNSEKANSGYSANPSKEYPDRQEIIRKSYEIEKFLAKKPPLPPQPSNKPVIRQAPKTLPVIHLTKKIEEVPAEKKNIYDIILLGDQGFDSRSKEFGLLLEEALHQFSLDDAYVLKLNGKTYGLGARGIKVVGDSIEYVAYKKNDVEKMVKKYSSLTNEYQNV